MKTGSRLRRWFITGIILLVPVVVTFYLLAAVVRTMDGMINLIPQQYQPVQLLGFDIPGLGLILTLLIVLVTGMIGASFIGKRLVRLGERILARIPLVRAVYGSLKHVLETTPLPDTALPSGGHGGLTTPAEITHFMPSSTDIAKAMTSDSGT